MNDESVTPSQKSLCAKIETKAVAGLHSDASLSRHKRAHLETSSLVRGSRRFRPPPRHTCRARSSTSVFNSAPACRCGYAVHLWRRSPDRWGDQTLACCGACYRVLGHNAVRDMSSATRCPSSPLRLLSWRRQAFILPPAPLLIHALPTSLDELFLDISERASSLRTSGSPAEPRGHP